MPEKNVVSWSTMINGYVQVGMFEEALELFIGMQICGVRPNQAGIIGALIACLENHLRSGSAIELFVSKQNEGVAPNEITFICILSVCSRIGLVDQGLRA
ncbi:hypothetical protein Dsin_012668 [Dipteronia sinensis]|uniref:Pentatricopeptide repeat-containing protein n=1 Tax=Dipteronia sinensis TaxID=43782 RepID=A0AAE0AIH9_9ROSI|nr:hypothetical protein Dsin_012668 [Dipteronia sinensis]